MRFFSLIASLAIGVLTATEATPQGIPTSGTAIEDSIGRSDAALRYELLKSSFEPTYITALGGWGNAGDKLLFEANLAPHLSFASSKMTLVLTPKIVLRMFDAPSAPVRRPSFMPRATLYLPLGDRLSFGDRMLTAASITLSHHSNGQDGEFYAPGTRELNTRDGSFSLNYLEFAVSISDRISGTPFVSSRRTGLRINLPINESHELRDSVGDQYGTYRFVSSGISIQALADLLGIKNDLLNSRVLVAADYSYVLDPRFRSEAFFSWQRFDGSVSAVWMPPLAENAGVLFNYYWGQDYYNMSYKHRLKVFRIGVFMNATTSFLRPQ